MHADVAAAPSEHPLVQGTCGTCHDTPNVGNHSLPAPLDIGTYDPGSNASVNLGGPGYPLPAEHHGVQTGFEQLQDDMQNRFASVGSLQSTESSNLHPKRQAHRFYFRVAELKAAQAFNNSHV